MTPHSNNPSSCPEQVEPRRRTVRSSGASGHRVRTVAGLPTIRATAPADTAPAAASSSPNVSSIGASVLPPGGSGTPLRTSVLRDADPAQFPKWTYVAAGMLAALLCFVASRPIWQRSHGPAPVMIHESSLPDAGHPPLTAAAAPARPQEYVALPASRPPADLDSGYPGSVAPGERQVSAAYTSEMTGHPSSAASGSQAPELARHAPTPSDPPKSGSTPGVASGAEPAPSAPGWLSDSWDDQDAGPRLAQRDATESGTTGPALEAPSDEAPLEYPSTNYPTVVPSDAPPRNDSSSVSPSAAAPAPAGPALHDQASPMVGGARLDGNIEPFQSDES